MRKPFIFLRKIVKAITTAEKWKQSADILADFLLFVASAQTDSEDLCGAAWNVYAEI